MTGGSLEGGVTHPYDTGGQVLQVLGWALTRIRNLPLVRYSQAKGAVRWLCVEQSRELFSDIRGRGGASNACFHS